MRKVYIFPPILVGINFFILIVTGIIFLRKEIKIWDCIFISIGIILTIIFIVLLILTHRIEQIHMKPENVDKLVTVGPYSILRHPNYAGIIYMNIACLLLFRSFWLLPIIIVFIGFWFLEARYEERILINKFGKAYKEYMIYTGMFLPKLGSITKIVGN